MKRLFLLSLVIVFAGFQQVKASNLPLPADTNRLLRVNYNNVKGTRDPMFRFCIGAGRAGEGLRADWQQQLKIVQKDIGFKYIRFHGLLSDDMHVYTEDAKGNPVYNWQYVDRLYDFLLSINIKPFVEFGFMPPAMASGETTVFWWKGNITPPKSYDKWGALIKAMVLHFEERYGKAEVKQWYFEVWNEPNLKQFFSGDMQTYFKLYEVTAKAVKSVSPDYRVGGPATSGSTWIKESLEYFATIPKLVDFISTHAYGTKTVFDEFENRRAQMREPDGVPIALNKLNNDVQASKMKGREIHITEWNSSSNPRDPIHDTYQNASYALNAIRKSEGRVNSMAYRTFTDIFEEAGPPVTPFHGGFGLLTLQDIKKPTYFAFKYLAKLGVKELISTDSSSIITKDDKGNLQALFWDYRLQSPDTSYNQQFYGRVLPAAKIGNLKLSISGMPDGKYKVAILKTGYLHNDPYTAYLKMGSPYNLSKMQEIQLKNLTIGNPDAEIVMTTRSGKLERDFPLMQNDVYFVSITKIP